MPQLTDGVRLLPRQQRSRVVVDAVLEAAAQVLERDGEAGFNTNAVAERAGVSIGTLYRYFASKEAVLQALTDRETRIVRQAMMEALTTSTDLAPDRAAIRAFLTAFRGRTLVRQIALRAMLARSPVSAESDGAIEALLVQKDGRRLPPLQAFILVRALLGVVRSVVLERPEWLSSKELEDELVRLARRYVEGSGPLPAPTAPMP